MNQLDILEHINTPTPILELEEFDKEFGISVFVKLDYLNHPIISGNKWRKLKGNLDFIIKNNVKGIVSYGGSHSNHLYALSGVRQIFGIPVVVMVRGDGFDENNKTLKFARDVGVVIHYVDRTEYRKKENSLLVQSLISKYPDYMVIPEGGSNSLALPGISELLHEIEDQIPDFTHIVISMGTGGTAAGILYKLPIGKKLVVYPALKGSWVKNEIEKMILMFEKNAPEKQILLPDVKNQLMLRDQFHFGGYAKMPHKLLKFIDEMKNKYKLPLDAVYTGKAFYGMLEDIKSGMYPKESKVVFIHSGGLR